MFTKVYTNKTKKSFTTAYNYVVKSIQAERNERVEAFRAEIKEILGQTSFQQMYNYINGKLYMNEEQIDRLEKLFAEYGIDEPWDQPTTR